MNYPKAQLEKFFVDLLTPDSQVKAKIKL